MDIHWFESLESTQTYLMEELKALRLSPPVCVGASSQTKGKGSRGNEWIGHQGNLFVSIAIQRALLPNDLKLESTSIYLAYLMKQWLAEQGSSIWLKWPNDFYIEDRKIGGVITNLVDDVVICGIGINVASAPENFGVLDLAIAPYEIIKSYSRLFEKLPSWKQIFSNYEIEFENSRKFFTHNNNEKIALERCILLEDGSLQCDDQRIFSLR